MRELFYIFQLKTNNLCAFIHVCINECIHTHTHTQLSLGIHRGLFPGFPKSPDAQVLYQIMQYLHTTYTHPPIYFKSSLDYSLSCVQFFAPMDCSLSGSSVHGILQARPVEWVAMSSSRVSFLPRDSAHISCICRQILYHLSHQGSPQITQNT